MGRDEMNKRQVALRIGSLLAALYVGNLAGSLVYSKALDRLIPRILDPQIPTNAFKLLWYSAGQGSSVAVGLLLFAVSIAIFSIAVRPYRWWFWLISFCSFAAISYHMMASV